MKFNIKIGDNLRVGNKSPGARITSYEAGQVIAEYEHHFLLKNKKYQFSVNKSAILDGTVVIKRGGIA